jgi:hypothetical protein
MESRKHRGHEGLSRELEQPHDTVESDPSRGGSCGILAVAPTGWGLDDPQAIAHELVSLASAYKLQRLSQQRRHGVEVF